MIHVQSSVMNLLLINWGIPFLELTEETGLLMNYVNVEIEIREKMVKFINKSMLLYQ